MILKLFTKYFSKRIKEVFCLIDTAHLNIVLLFVYAFVLINKIPYYIAKLHTIRYKYTHCHTKHTNRHMCLFCLNTST